MQSNDFNKMYAKIRDLNDDTILDEGAWSDLWHGSREEKKADQSTKDAYDAYRLEKVTKKFEKDGLSPEDARKYAYRKVYGAPIEENRMGFKDLDKLGRENASKVDQECRRRGSADMEPGDADQLRYKVAKEMGLVEYDEDAVDKEIKKDPRIKGKEAKMIKSLLKGRKKDSKDKVKENGILEGTWAIPDTEEAVSDIEELMKEPLLLGPGGEDATNAIGGAIGDDGLFDDLGDAGDEDPNADARPIIADWIIDNIRSYPGMPADLASKLVAIAKGGNKDSNPQMELPLGEEDRGDGHDINLLKAVAKQFAQDAESGDYTAIDDLLKNVPEAQLKGFLSELESMEALQSKAGMAETNISKIISHIKGMEPQHDVTEGGMSDVHIDAQEMDRESFVEKYPTMGDMWDEVHAEMNEDFDKDHPDFPKAQAWTNEKDIVKGIIAKHPEAAKTLERDGDVFSIYDTDLYMDLFNHFAEDMPYGTQKGRDGDPVEWMNDQLDDMGILESAPMSEGKQKPYVSSYQGSWMVMNSDGEVVTQFKDKEEAFDYLEQYYNDLILESTSGQKFYGRGSKTYFHKINKEFKIVPEGYKKTKNGMITKVIK